VTTESERAAWTQARCRPRFGVGGAWLACLCLSLVACGKDEILDVPQAPPSAPATVSVKTPQLEAGTLDVCAAVGSILATPAVPEALCAGTIGREAGNPASFESQCRQCTLVASLLFAFTPTPTCPQVYADCPITNDELTACTSSAASNIAQSLISCDTGAGSSLSQATIQSAFTTPSCVTVFFKCPAILDALVGALALPAAGNSPNPNKGGKFGGR
jgi:hypothetical protein